MSELSTHNPRESLTASLITQGLGYCCEAWFWRRFAEVPSETVAIRLGVVTRTIQRRRALFNQGELKCLKKEKCLERRLTPNGSASSRKPTETEPLKVSKKSTDDSV